MVTHAGEGIVLGGQPRPGGWPWRTPILWILRHALVCTRLDRATKFGVVTHMGRGAFRRSAMPLHLCKCVARFLSDSLVSCCTFENGEGGAMLIAHYRPMCVFYIARSVAFI